MLVMVAGKSKMMISTRTLKVAVLVAFCLIQSDDLQGQSKDRIKLVHQFITDLRNDSAVQVILQSYMESQGIYTIDRMRTLSNEGTEYFRQRVKETAIDSITVYKYNDRPEKGRVRKLIGEAAGIEYAPLEFEVHVSPTEKQFDVDTNNLYVLLLGEERYFILFNARDQIIGFLGIQWGNRVAIMKF